MNPEFPPLNPLRVFESVARHLSFTAAAKELHITQGAVSHQIKTLETWLGFELFDRTNRRLKLTRSGEVYGAELTNAFAHIVQATQNLLVSGAHQILTVRGYTTLFVRWLIPYLPKFQADHPDIRVRLFSTSTDGTDFRREQADVGIIYGEGPWPGLHSDLLWTDALTPVMSPELAAKLPSPCSVEDLLALPLLYSNRRPQHWSEWIAKAGATRGRNAGDIYCEDLSIVYQYAVDGLGIALGQLPYVAKELESGALVAPHPLVLTTSRGYHMVCPTEYADEPKVARFREWLLARVQP
ncbi:MAG: transcriptional regulator GcvA [Ramlibacter sp.]|jgi:LysR family glycine cleavage system transcriptional activator|uniref:transcriptional regulator GcvA n=1 Tax=Ramlibacter sp. TaxID=1917967 RepID=UPI0026120070|nr:transcriptional regulator GcvA [Ramlibacter sp.]MDH4378162.1 transcriptional regulator GcvA [Ramlibacter sp.]